jgi:hypothetical protein
MRDIMHDIDETPSFAFVRNCKQNSSTLWNPTCAGMTFRYTLIPLFYLRIMSVSGFSNLFDY